MVRHGSLVAPGTKAPVPRQPSVEDIDQQEPGVGPSGTAVVSLGDLALGEHEPLLDGDDALTYGGEQGGPSASDPTLSEAEQAKRDRLWGLVESAQAVPLEERKESPIWQDAWGNLFLELYPTILKYAFYRRVQDGSVSADDWAMEAMARGMEKIHQLQRTPGSPVAWFITVARTIRSDHIKSAAFQRTHVDGLLTEAYEEDGSVRTVARADVFVDDEAVDRVERAKEVELVRRAFEIMCKGRSADQVEALKYQYWDGFSSEVIGSLTGRDNDAVKALLYRGRKTLRITIERLAKAEPEVAKIIASLTAKASKK